MSNDAAAQPGIISEIQRQQDVFQPRRMSPVGHPSLTLLEIIDGVAQEMQSCAETLSPEEISVRVQTIRLAVQRLGSLLDDGPDNADRGARLPLNGVDNTG